MTTPVDLLTEDEVAERAGTTVERVRELRDLGLLEPDQGMFRRRDVLRARVFSELTAMGIEASALAAAQATGELSLGYLESAGRRHPRSDLTFRAAGRRPEHHIRGVRGDLHRVRSASAAPR
jgi:hypothetical protein